VKLVDARTARRIGWRSLGTALVLGGLFVFESWRHALAAVSFAYVVALVTLVEGLALRRGWSPLQRALRVGVTGGLAGAVFFVQSRYLFSLWSAGPAAGVAQATKLLTTHYGHERALVLGLLVGSVFSWVGYFGGPRGDKGSGEGLVIAAAQLPLTIVIAAFVGLPKQPFDWVFTPGILLVSFLLFAGLFRVGFFLCDLLDGRLFPADELVPTDGQEPVS